MIHFFFEENYARYNYNLYIFVVAIGLHICLYIVN